MTIDFKLPKYSEIPGVGLFLEQVSKYINEILSPLEEADLTGSMISNYVKKGIIDSPVKKQYSRDQIAYLIYITMAKNVISLDNIRTMIMLQKQECDTQTAYHFFCDEFSEVLSAVFENREIPAKSSESELKQLSKNVSVTIAYKVYLDMSFKKLSSEKS
ncbi:MAG: DUF1836 domain-containing protein [Coriobacteriales bacterium]|nr:DUF1836 domain-containing protein [Coriobacteriales bacterium]